jgi:hypothetical protein
MTKAYLGYYVLAPTCISSEFLCQKEKHFFLHRLTPFSEEIMVHPGKIEDC